jgi:hypothetical protein
MTILARFILMTLLLGPGLVACGDSNTPASPSLADDGQPTLVLIYTDA